MTNSNNPFSAPFEVFGNESSRFLSDGINDSAYDTFIGRLEDPVDASGCVVLLRSPRAGYGKTALLQRARMTLSESHLFLPFSLLSGHKFDSGQLLEDILTELSQQLPEGGGLTAIDYVSRRILARGLEPMIASGEIHSQNKEEALDAIRKTPEKTFDFHDDEAATAQWIRDNFETVGSRLATELSIASKATLREVAYWVELFYRYASTLPTSVARNGQLFETVFGGQERRGSSYNERVMGLIRLLNVVTRPVLVLDDTEGLSGLPAASLEVVSGLVSLSQACKGTAVVLCMNSDIWESGVAPRLPGGLKDRVMDKIVDLKPLSKDQARDLIRFHAGASAGPWIDDIDLGDGVLYSRGVLKLASEVWRDRLKTPEPIKVEVALEQKEVSEPIPAASVAPVAFVDDFSKELLVETGLKGEGLVSAPIQEAISETPEPVEEIVAENVSQVVTEIQSIEPVIETPIQPLVEARDVDLVEGMVAPVDDQDAPVMDTPFQLPSDMAPQETISEIVEEGAPVASSPFVAESTPVEPQPVASSPFVAESTPVEPQPVASSPFVAESTPVEPEPLASSPFSVETTPVEPEALASSPFTVEAAAPLAEEVKDVIPAPIAQAAPEVAAEPVFVEPAPVADQSPFIVPAEAANPFETHGGFSPFNVEGQGPVEEKSTIPQPRPQAPETFVPQISPPTSPFTAAAPDFNAPVMPQQGIPVDPSQGVVQAGSPFQVAPQGQQPIYQPPAMPEPPRQDPRAFQVQATVSQDGVQAPQQQMSSPFQMPQTAEPVPQPMAPSAPAQATPAPFANPFKNPFTSEDSAPPQVAPTPSPAQEAPRAPVQPAAQVFANPFAAAEEQPAPTQSIVNEPSQPVQEPFANPFAPASTTPPASPAPVSPAPVEQAPTQAEGGNEEKRVEDLLEQFKNRYGRD